MPESKQRIEQQGLVERYARLVALVRAYLPPDTEIGDKEFIGRVIEIVDRPVGGGEHG